MKNLQLVPDIHYQQSIVIASFCFDQKRHAFKRLLEAKKLIPLRIYLGHKADHFPQVSTQELENIVNPLDYYYQKKSGTIHAKMGCIEPLKQRDKENKHHKGVYTK